MLSSPVLKRTAIWSAGAPDLLQVRVRVPPEGTTEAITGGMTGTIRPLDQAGSLAAVLQRLVTV